MLCFLRCRNPLQTEDIEAFPSFTADAQPALHSSVLGTLIPGLDPDRPDYSTGIGATSSSANATSTFSSSSSAIGTPTAGIGSKRLRPSSTPTPRTPAVDESCGNGAAGRFAGRDRGGDRDVEKTKSGRRVAHGLRVLLRGTARCGRVCVMPSS